MEYYFIILVIFSLACSNKSTSKSSKNSKKAVKRTMKKFNKNILPGVLREYNRQVKNGRVRLAKNCLKFRKEFKRAAKVSGFPMAWIMGKAFHESFCNNKSRDWAGGVGLMQITSKPTKRYRKRLAKMIGISEKGVNYKRYNLHNILMGTLFLADYETRLMSRPHGLLAYNMGVGGVRRILRKMGLSRKDRPSIKKMMPHLRYDKKMKPRVYVERVLASVLIANRVITGKSLTRLKKLSSKDLPGWDPMQDPWRE